MGGWGGKIRPSLAVNARRDALVANVIFDVLVVVIVAIDVLVVVIFEIVVAICPVCNLAPRSSVDFATSISACWKATSASRSSLFKDSWPNRSEVAAGLVLVQTGMLLAKSYLDHVPGLDIAGTRQDH